MYNTDQPSQGQYPYGGPPQQQQAWAFDYAQPQQVQQQVQQPQSQPQSQYPSDWYAQRAGPSAYAHSNEYSQHQQQHVNTYPQQHAALRQQYTASPQRPQSYASSTYQPSPRSTTSATFPPTYTPTSQNAGNTPEVAEGVAVPRMDKPVLAPKKKRKKLEYDEKPSTPPGDGDKEKRTKTGRACDACRTKKIRCDILASTESPGGHVQPLCAHCKQYDLECTFFLPITETRFKKRKDDVPLDPTIITNPLAHTSTSPEPQPSQHHREVPTRVEGPTSLSFLLSTSLPASASEAYDLREHNKWEISEDGNGLIRVNAPPSALGYADANPDDPAKTHNRLNKPFLSAHTISLLVNAYFDHLADVFPIISKAEFAAKVNPSPLLLYSICGLGATRRHFPREVFSSVRGVINGLLRSNDILSDARFENVQALMGDLHAQPTAATASAALIRMGAATRMAQDLGLHRESTQSAQSALDLANIELRRRVWATCVILDRWYAAALGVPLLIDLLDCDVLLPAPYEIIPDAEPSGWPLEPSYIALAEHLKLSILIGRVIKTIYSPTGLKYTTDDQLNSLVEDIQSWKDNLPESLRFLGSNSPMGVGLLHMSFTALQFLFWRVFMRIVYTCPPHLTFHLRKHHWDDICQLSRESIQWLASNNEALDTLFIYPYTATSCALVQYHTWARRRDPQALELLKLIKETATRWEAAVQPDQMSIRRKTCETMTLLYEAALKTNPETLQDHQDRPSFVNPTAGVQARPDFGMGVWFVDDNEHKGGIWLIESEADLHGSGLNRSDVICLDELSDGDRARGAEQLRLNKERAQKQQAAVEETNAKSRLSPTRQALNDMQNPANVNPALNSNNNGSAMQLSQGHLNFTAPQSTNVNGTFDLSMLDGLPMSGFDFGSWDTYFDQINHGAVPSQHGAGAGFLNGSNGQAGFPFT